MKLTSVGLPATVAKAVREAQVVHWTQSRGTVTLPEFLAHFMTFPPWVGQLFKGRALLARALGLRHAPMPRQRPLDPDRIPFVPGRPLRLFITEAGAPDHFWMGRAPSDRHLDALLAVVRLCAPPPAPSAEDRPPVEPERNPRGEPKPRGSTPASEAPSEARFLVLTLLRYGHWSGRIYYPLVRPFHHIIVWSQARSAARSDRGPVLSRR